MSNVIYATKDECLKAIATLKAIGMEPLPWMLEQLKAFENSEKQVSVAHDSDTPIWDTLQAKYPYGVMPIVFCIKKFNTEKRKTKPSRRYEFQNLFSNLDFQDYNHSD